MTILTGPPSRPTLERQIRTTKKSKESAVRTALRQHPVKASAHRLSLRVCRFCATQV